MIARKDEILATVAAPAATAAAANAAPNVMTRAAAAARQKQKSADQKKKQKTKKHEARETRGKGKKIARKASPAEFSTASDSSSNTSDTFDASSSSMQFSDNPSEVGAGSKQQQVGIDGTRAAVSRRPHPFSSAAAAVKSPTAGISIELSTNAYALDDRTRSLNTWVTADLGGEMQALHESFSGLQIKVLLLLPSFLFVPPPADRYTTV